MPSSKREKPALLRMLDRITLVEPIVLAVLAIGTASLWGFIEIADEVIEGETDAFDRAAVRALRNPNDLSDPIGPPWFEEIARDATALGGIGWLAFAVVVVAVYLWLIDKRHMMVFTLVAAMGGVVLSLLLKWAFARPRPDIVPHLSHVATSSFPSGHSMLAAVLYLTLGTLLAAIAPTRGLKVYVLGVGILLTIFVGASRVYLGVHYPTDVLGGWLAGLVWALLCWLVARRLQKVNKVECDEISPQLGAKR